MTRTIILAALAATALGGAAVAQGMQGMGPHGGMGIGGMGHGPFGGIGLDFATLDADGDGQVTAEEITAAAQGRFAAADADGNGGIDAAEMLAHAEAQRQAMMAARMDAMVAELDDNGDGLIQAEEFAARLPGPELALDHLDADDSGGISAEEFAAMRERMGERMRGGEGRGWHHGDGDGGGWGFWRRNDG